jgi:hypothetical protein
VPDFSFISGLLGLLTGYMALKPTNGVGPKLNDHKHKMDKVKMELGWVHGLKVKA